MCECAQWRGLFMLDLCKSRTQVWFMSKIGANLMFTSTLSFKSHITAVGRRVYVCQNLDLLQKKTLKIRIHNPSILNRHHISGQRYRQDADDKFDDYRSLVILGHRICTLWKICIILLGEWKSAWYEECRTGRKILFFSFIFCCITSFCLFRSFQPKFSTNIHSLNLLQTFTH